MNATVPADPRLRKRAIIIALTLTLVGLVSLYLFRRFLYEVEALATASPQLAFEKLNPVGTVAAEDIMAGRVRDLEATPTR
jgi:hypothetical protein